jgi:hypothetical protein
MSKARKHTMPDNNAQIQREVEARTGIRPYIWQIEVVCKVIKGGDVMTITATSFDRSLCYWMVLLYVRYGDVLCSDLILQNNKIIKCEGG